MNIILTWSIKSPSNFIEKVIWTWSIGESRFIFLCENIRKGRIYV